VSPRTIHRIMQTLSMANVPWYFCKEDGCYRVRSGYRFPGLEDGASTPAITDPTVLKCLVDTLLKDLMRTVESLRRVSEELGKAVGKP